MAALIKKSTLNFLTNLSKNNNRDWFLENKEQYLAAQENIINFVEELLEEAGKFDAELLKLDAKRTLFRIYRDTRFSKDKTPYKTNFGASLGMGKGRKTSGYYLHIEPGKSFLAGGVYQPENGPLKKIREKIAQNSDAFLKIISNRGFKTHFGELSQNEKLKKIPQGFDKDNAMAEFLKLKSFIGVHPLKDEEVMHPEAIRHFSAVFKSLLPLNQFLDELSTEFFE